MQAPAMHELEEQRLARLYALHLLDTPPEARFDRLTRLAAALLDVPIALVSIVDADRQWFKSKVGLSADETPRSISFCGHAILQEGAFVVEDALDDQRFADNPLVTGAPDIRFYAGQPLRTSDGLPMGTLCVIDRKPRRFSDAQRALLRDLAMLVEEGFDHVTLSKALKAELQATEAKDALLMAISHDLRTPLTAIRGALGLAEHLAQPLSEQAKKLPELLTLAIENAQRMNRMIDDLLDSEKAASGQMRFDCREYPLSELLKTELANMSSYGAKRNIGLRMQSAMDDRRVKVDAERLLRALDNLISNAMKFAPANSEVEVSVEYEGQWAKLAVRDYGPGIAVDFLPHLFQRFAQAGQAQKSSSGLGLFLVKAMLEGMGGKVSVEANLQPGACFTLWLPLADA